MLTVRALTRDYGGGRGLRGVDLEVARGEIVCLLGPSGCGKTTLLRIVAGLERADAGEVILDGRSIMDVPIHQRGFGLMFQDFALFPHLNVLQNVEFGLKMAHMPSRERRARAQEVLDLVDMADFATRDVTSLSGGEKQRIALARSLAPNPRLLMLDEPLGALDAALRDRLLVDLRAIMKRVGLTALYVTHDQNEAFAVADKIALMNNGMFEQVAPPAALYRRPASRFAARFLGMNNIVRVGDRDMRSCAQQIVGLLPHEANADYVLVHPDGLTVDPQGAIEGSIREVTYQGGTYRVTMTCDDDLTLTFRIPARAGDGVAVGGLLRVTIDPAYLIPLTR